MSGPLLEIRDLRVRFGEVETLRGTTFHIQPGELVALLGANGAGKSTVAAALCGLRAPSSGELLWEGTTLAGLSPQQRVALGMVLVPAGQRPFLTLSVREHLDLALDARRVPGRQRAARIDAVLDICAGLRARLRMAGGLLPALEQRQLALACALLLAPKLLILDEASAGLTPEAVEQWFELLARVHAEGTGLLLIEQNAQQALRIADRGYVLELGRTTLSGPATVLLRDPRVVTAFLGG